VQNFFLNFLEDYSEKTPEKLRCLLMNISGSSKLFPKQEALERKDWFLRYMNSVFAGYLCQFQLGEKGDPLKIYPDFLRHCREAPIDSKNIEISPSLQGHLYREVVELREKLVKRTKTGVVYEFQQTHFDEGLAVSLEDPWMVAEILEILALYYREIGFLIRELGALNESEVFLGVLIEKSSFCKTKHLESFGFLSQAGLANIYLRVVASFNEKFKDFEENRTTYAKHTYTVSYYYAGCYLADVGSGEILKALDEFYRGNRVFLGLSWLVFPEMFAQIKAKK
jgi:hypothetical protein